ncbi:hypothetical protein F383_36525 [Gossypium arboreum]|uniref:Uncharacterized protein n=1 Tax=Gossypium arboreum TaxID=29729 RepID=A0A0B0NBE9_GOSAR|nr:hypothetical protein F383_36525 [Gossypium arboreum]
MCCREGFSPEG